MGVLVLSLLQYSACIKGAKRLKIAWVLAITTGIQKHLGLTSDSVHVRSHIIIRNNHVHCLFRKFRLLLSFSAFEYHENREESVFRQHNSIFFLLPKPSQSTKTSCIFLTRRQRSLAPNGCKPKPENKKPRQIFKTFKLFYFSSPTFFLFYLM